MTSLHTQQARRVVEELEDTISWVDLFGLEFGLPDELRDELHTRLEHIERLVVRL